MLTFVNYMTMQKILVPTDFNPLSDNALTFACELAGSVSCEIFLVNVQSLPANDDASMAVELIKTIQTANEERLQQTVKSVNEKFPGLKISAHFSFGIPSSTIKDYLDTNEFDFVVMGSRGATGADRFFMGSVAESVSKHAPCPVFIIHSENQYKPLKNFVVPIDINYKFSALYKAVNKIVDLAAVFNGTVNWCYVETSKAPIDGNSLNFQLDDGNSIQIDVVNNPTVEDGIIGYCHEKSPDLLVIIKRDYSFVEKIFHHNVFADLLNNQDLPIMVIHF
jgi:nucleotide-binding universal stress UspA family protein